MKETKVSTGHAPVNLNPILSLEESNRLSRNKARRFGKLIREMAKCNNLETKWIIFMELQSLATNWQHKEMIDSMGNIPCPISDPQKRFDFLYDEYAFSEKKPTRQAFLKNLILSDPEIEDIAKVSFICSIPDEIYALPVKFGDAMGQIRNGNTSPLIIDIALNSANKMGEFEQITNFLLLKGISFPN